MPVLIGLADEFAGDGFVAKAIAILKRVDRIQPGRADVESRLARLVKLQRSAPVSAPRGRQVPEFGIEEIREDPADAVAPEPRGGRARCRHRARCPRVAAAEAALPTPPRTPIPPAVCAGSSGGSWPRSRACAGGALGRSIPMPRHRTPRLFPRTRASRPTTTPCRSPRPSTRATPSSPNPRRPRRRRPRRVARRPTTRPRPICAVQAGGADARRGAERRSRIGGADREPRRAGRDHREPRRGRPHPGRVPMAGGLPGRAGGGGGRRARPTARRLRRRAPFPRRRPRPNRRPPPRRRTTRSRSRRRLSRSAFSTSCRTSCAGRTRGTRRLPRPPSIAAWSCATPSGSWPRRSSATFPRRSCSRWCGACGCTSTVPATSWSRRARRGQSVFVLASGAAKVFVRSPSGRNFPVAELRDGDFFGEISSLSGRPRSATVTAAARCELLELDRPTLDEIARAHPRVAEVLEEFYIRRASSPEAAAVRAVPLSDAGTERKAIEVLEAHFGQSRWDPRMRLRLADVLLKAGKYQDAVPVLIGLADDLARAGFPEKAIAVLKKIEKIQRRDVEVVNLAPLASGAPRPPPRPRAPQRRRGRGRPDHAAAALGPAGHGRVLRRVARGRAARSRPAQRARRRTGGGGAGGAGRGPRLRTGAAGQPPLRGLRRRRAAGRHPRPAAAHLRGRRHHHHARASRGRASSSSPPGP